MERATTSDGTWEAVVQAVAGSPAVPVDTVTHTPEPCEGCERLARGFMTALDQAGFVVMTRADAERQRREIEFVEMLCDGGDLAVNGIPWREAFERLNALVSDPV